LAIDLPHVLQINTLPDHHKDPFDRILIAQAQVENIPILKVDRMIIEYPVQTIW
jgi:PIN domain nuclease of toxin-antitoxin system